MLGTDTQNGRTSKCPAPKTRRDVVGVSATTANFFSRQKDSALGLYMGERSRSGASQPSEETASQSDRPRLRPPDQSTLPGLAIPLTCLPSSRSSEGAHGTS